MKNKSLTFGIKSKIISDSMLNRITGGSYNSVIYGDQGKNGVILITTKA